MNRDDLGNLMDNIDFELDKIRNNEAYIKNKSYFGLDKELLSYIRNLEQALDEIEKICNSVLKEDNICDIGKIHDIEVIIQKTKEDKKIEKINWLEKESLARNLTTIGKQGVLARRTEKLKASLNELIDEINKLKEK